MAAINGFLFISCFWLAEGYLNNGLLSISITRHHKGDIFSAQGEKCYKDFCISLSGATAVPTGNSECECKCTPDRPVFRDDLNVCVNDIQECDLVPFASSSVIKKIPYVFLPLKGQIVYPSADIIISDVEAPVCVVSGGQFLGQSGWLNLRNNSGADTPFRLFRDEGRTYLQWVGESSLRMAMEGRIILVHLMCKNAYAADEPKIFTPCIAFRVAGNPSVKEMMFITDVHLKEEYGGGLSMREYIAIGVCSLLLAIVYAAVVFFYLNFRKRKHKKGNKKTGEDAQLTLEEEGVIKSNPLLQATRHLSVGGQENAGYISESNSCCSDADQSSDLLCLDDDNLMGSQNVRNSSTSPVRSSEISDKFLSRQMQTSAIIHPCDLDYGETIVNQDSNNIEKLPEENVSIVETLEVKDDHSETVKAMGCANGRRKLYFNPTYFEPDLLKAPPPAAMEFLTKIREVITIAKHKMSAKKFSPSLLGIPEEDGSNSALTSKKDFTTVEKTESRDSILPLEMNSTTNFQILPNELSWSSDTKQKIIRKWLEDVPVMTFLTDEQKSQKVTSQENKILNKSNLWQMNKENIVKEKNRVSSPPVRQEKRKTKGRAPPVPPLKADLKQETSKTVPQDGEAPPRPPPLPSFKHNSDDIPRVQGKDFVPPAVAKNLMDAVIQELTSYKKTDKNSKLKELPGKINDAIQENNELVSEALDKQTEAQKEEEPRTEEGMPKIENTKTSRAGQQDDHEYEIILLDSNGGKDLKIYNLPEIFSKNDKIEGYSLVSEVYVNDGYSCCSGESPPSSYSNLSAESDKAYYNAPNEKPGRLTIHVNDSPERYKNSASESDNFEPDTLDRKPRRTKLVKKLNEESERYSNQKFHDMECCIKPNKCENFTDSLERPRILLKTNGTFKRNSLERNIDDLFRNFSWSKVENVGSLREIYEAKSRKPRKNAETTSLIVMGSPDNDHDRLSTLSWSEERRNKLLHRGIILHINEGDPRKHRKTPATPSQIPFRPPKPSPAPRSRSVSPVIRSNCTSPSSRFPVSPRSMSPPLPPPRSIPALPSPRSITSSPPPSSPCSPTQRNQQPKSTNSSPVPTDFRRSSPFHSPCNSIQRNLKNSNVTTSCSSPTSNPNASPPPRPPKTISSSPLLPPRNSKPPLPPKNLKRHPKPGKFAGRPLPPLPRSLKDYSSSSPTSCRDPETLSTLSGASLDSLNSSDYEAFYTLPYEEEEEDIGSSSKEDTTRQHVFSNAITVLRSPSSSISNTGSRRMGSQRSREAERRPSQGASKTIPHRPEDSGYLSTDSDSCCPQLTFPMHFSRIPENGSQNSETEESLCDGASESGGESIATDSFFYGNFKKKSDKNLEEGVRSEVHPYNLRLSDVEVNSDTERHCVPIMVRP